MRRVLRNIMGGANRKRRFAERELSAFAAVKRMRSINRNARKQGRDRQPQPD